jgi:MinD superfamily P-loop ATPase
LKIAVLSGKGGTGKTFVSVNLACVTSPSVYVDCDVEEPNGHLFLKPVVTHRSPVKVKIPMVDLSKCTGCRKCVDFCKYNALAYIRDNLLVFKEICHSCGGCSLLCPSKALSEKEREVGSIEEGLSDQVTVLTGCLNTGEASGIPIIKGLMGKLTEQGTIVIDCPPGSACIVMESIREADFCLLVAEPTVFGVHNLAMVYDLVKLFNKPFGVVLNKCLEEENPAERFCRDNQIKILAKIPFDEELGRCISDGLIAVREKQKYHRLFKELLVNLTKEMTS